MTYKTAFNPGDTPVVVDAEGRVIGGGEWGPVSTVDEPVKSAIGDRRLVYVDLDPEAADLAPAARDAARATSALAARDAELSAMEPADLQRAAAKAGLVGDDDRVTKTELVHLLTRRPDVAVAKSRRASRETA